VGPRVRVEPRFRGARRIGTEAIGAFAGYSALARLLALVPGWAFPPESDFGLFVIGSVPHPPNDESRARIVGNALIGGRGAVREDALFGDLLVGQRHRMTDFAERFP